MNPEQLTHLTDQITAAIAAHGMWKQRLRNAIATGATDISLETIRADNQCVFGKWLYSDTIPQHVKNGEDYQAVLRLHAEFHKVAARVAELAVAGNKVEAEGLMQLGGEFTLASSKLTQAMMKWREKLSAKAHAA
ncbi:MAG: CZB domain-containing protein [Bacteroidota bacterium]|nr:CZB domain-containing protein [Candidatus Kapabacteria bacterium]MDW8221068.1 CZB domain-containing protein [Bacteroidota bacterium]